MPDFAVKNDVILFCLQIKQRQFYLYYGNFSKKEKNKALYKSLNNSVL